MASYIIRPVRIEDAPAACTILRRSIEELCESDHHRDPRILAQWLESKVPANVAQWIIDPNNRVLVAVEDDTMLAVGAVRTNGEITLNYVSPDARFRGVSRALLAHLEGIAREFGNDTCYLMSTETARRFYFSAGYEQVGPPEGKFGTTSSYPMRKRLTVTPSWQL